MGRMCLAYVKAQGTGIPRLPQARLCYRIRLITTQPLQRGLHRDFQVPHSSN